MIQFHIQAIQTKHKFVKGVENMLILMSWNGADKTMLTHQQILMLV